jgi:hypothetical protein
MIAQHNMLAGSQSNEESVSPTKNRFHSSQIYFFVGLKIVGSE